MNFLAKEKLLVREELNQRVIYFTKKIDQNTEQRIVAYIKESPLLMEEETEDKDLLLLRSTQFDFMHRVNDQVLLVQAGCDGNQMYNTGVFLGEAKKFWDLENPWLHINS